MNKHSTSILKHFQMFRYFKRSLCKYLIQVVIIYAFAAIECAYADGIRHGTYFGLYVGKDFITAAIDSRLTIINGTLNLPYYKDDVCKISILNEHTIFFVEGLNSNVNNDFAFDAHEIARVQYNKQTEHIDIERLATDWARTMVKKITDIYPFYIKEISSRPNGEISQGFFISSENDKVLAVQATIKMQASGVAARFSPIVTFVEPNSWIFSGHGEILAEFVENHISERAKITIAQFNSRISGSTAPEIWATKTEMYVKTVTDWSGDVNIGGEIATIILEHGKKWRWFRRPSFCPLN